MVGRRGSKTRTRSKTSFLFCLCFGLLFCCFVLVVLFCFVVLFLFVLFFWLFSQLVLFFFFWLSAARRSLISSGALRRDLRCTRPQMILRIGSSRLPFHCSFVWRFVLLPFCFGFGFGLATRVDGFLCFSRGHPRHQHPVHRRSGRREERETQARAETKQAEREGKELIFRKGVDSAKAERG